MNTREIGRLSRPIIASAKRRAMQGLNWFRFTENDSMIRRQIKKSEFVDEPRTVWNAFVDLLATEDYGELTEFQKPAHLVFWYGAEVQNGGHLQYFHNSVGRRAVETLDALSVLQMDCQRAILADAISYASENPISDIDTVEDYVAEALEHKFDKFDSRYYECEPSSIDILEEYLKVNLNEFIEVI